MKRCVGILLLVISMQFGVLAIVLGAALATLCNAFLDVIATRKLLNYSCFEQIRDIFSGVSIGLIMGIVVYAFKFLISNTIFLLLVQVSVGGVVFVLLSFITKNENFKYICHMAKKRFRAKKL